MPENLRVNAVGIVPQKLERVQALRARGCDLVVILDSEAQTQAVAQADVLWTYSELC